MSEINRNPVLNSPEDITEELRCNIVSNNIDTLTINYEFTRFKKKVRRKEAGDRICAVLILSTDLNLNI